MASLTRTLTFTTLILLSGCLAVPKQRSMIALPGAGQSIDKFRSDDLGCRQFAGSQATTENGGKRRGYCATGEPHIRFV